MYLNFSISVTPLESVLKQDEVDSIEIEQIPNSNIELQEIETLNERSYIKQVDLRRDKKIEKLESVRYLDELYEKYKGMNKQSILSIFPDILEKGQFLGMKNGRTFDATDYKNSKIQKYQYTKEILDSELEVYYIEPKVSLVESGWLQIDEWKQLIKYREHPESESFHCFPAYKNNDYFQENKDSLSIILFTDDYHENGRKFLTFIYWIGEVNLGCRMNIDNTHVLCIVDRNQMKQYQKNNGLTKNKTFQIILF